MQTEYDYHTQPQASNESPNLLKMIIVIAAILIAACASGIAFGQKPLHPGHYTFKQLQRRGYTCTPFKGSVWVGRTQDSLKANVKPVK